jgi:hypothetical protein
MNNPIFNYDENNMIFLKFTLHFNFYSTELPYPPLITSAALNAAVDNAVDIKWTPGFDGNTPILRYVLQCCLLSYGKYNLTY